MRLIDLDKFLIDESEAYIFAQNITNDSLTRKVNLIVHKKIQKIIADTPTVDAVEVVRCKDCIHFREDGFCKVLMVYCGNEDWFCAAGKRETE